MQLICIIYISGDIYNIARDRFETNSVNVMKDRPVIAKKQEISVGIYQLDSVYQKTTKIFTRNKNTQNVCKPSWFVTNF